MELSSFSRYFDSSLAATIHQPLFWLTFNYFLIKLQFRCLAGLRIWLSSCYYLTKALETHKNTFLTFALLSKDFWISHIMNKSWITQKIASWTHDWLNEINWWPLKKNLKLLLQFASKDAGRFSKNPLLDRFVCA